MIPPALSSDIDPVSSAIERYLAGGLDEEGFKKIRVHHGIYTQRQPGRYVLRLRVPAGELTAPQLRAVAAVAERVAPEAPVHATTRQDLQLHWVPLREIPGVLKSLAEVGLTSRESGGNTVRNVGVCPLAGVCPQEDFDVTPDALGLNDWALRNPALQGLPRKFKASLSGCGKDCAFARGQDLGGIAALRGKKLGYHVYLGGGLGGQPRAGTLLEPFTPREAILPTLAAALRVFERRGERKVKSRARLKHLIWKYGWETLRGEILSERANQKSLGGGLVDEDSVGRGLVPRRLEGPALTPPRAADPLFSSWLRANALCEKSGRTWSIQVPLCLGDIRPGEIRGVAEAMEAAPGATLRVTQAQNLVLRGVPEGALPRVHEILLYGGLALSTSAARCELAACPGAAICGRGLTRARDLGKALGRMLASEAGRGSSDFLEGMSIRVSGCPNGCGQHVLAALGFHGVLRRIGGKLVPHYLVLVGGSAEEKDLRFAQPALRIPARRVVEGIRRLMTLYASDRLPDERWPAFLRRLGPEGVRIALADLTLIPEGAPPESLWDLGQQGEFRLEDLTPSEC